jgi:carbon storage regulator
MLVLQRKKGESIVINGDIRVSIVEAGTDWVKLAIDAPKDIPILRSELLEAADANREASSIDKRSLLNLNSFLKKEE